MVEIKCYHGTTLEAANAIIREQYFKPSVGESLRLGTGAYFFEKLGKSNYAHECARDLEEYHFKTGKHTGKFAVLSCTIECVDDEYLDLFDPTTLEYFHKIRYDLYEKKLLEDPKFQYVDAAQADTATINFIRKKKRISLIRSPEFFGMFMREDNIKMSGRRKFPKTFVPNVIIVCADVKNTKIKNIKIEEEGVFE